MCSPRTRGWSHRQNRRPVDRAVLPAHAGMVPTRPPRTHTRWGAPRARGDGPRPARARPMRHGCSPRTRGWSCCCHLRRLQPRVLPAHAGMVPPGSRSPMRPPSAPRARGDGPSTHNTDEEHKWCSPRTRGWSPARRSDVARYSVLPAHAGMVPSRRRNRRRLPRAPRARGDGPKPRAERQLKHGCSPRTRGWSLPAGTLHQTSTVLPAHAGMVPPPGASPTACPGAPRARGDGPHHRDVPHMEGRCSPRTRGWSPQTRPPPAKRSVLPAHAGMVPFGWRCPIRTAGAPRARGDGPTSTSRSPTLVPCSPRTRGWSRLARHRVQLWRVLPAHAGMVPCRHRRRRGSHGAPRARGDGPGSELAAPITEAVLPAHAGMVPGSWTPPTGPWECSPRTRGWSPGHGRRRPGLGSAPRGDGPMLSSWLYLASTCSPRTRGWSRPGPAAELAAEVLPAHAGMVHDRVVQVDQILGAPRARGDGPYGRSIPTYPLLCSPRTRGWSRGQVVHVHLGRVLPAHAGMVRTGSRTRPPPTRAPRARGDGP